MLKDTKYVGFIINEKVDKSDANKIGVIQANIRTKNSQ